MFCPNTDEAIRRIIENKKTANKTIKNVWIASAFRLAMTNKKGALPCSKCSKAFSLNN
jgi:hypothetical protein